MHLKLTYVRPEGRAVDLGITVDASALVGDVADALYAQDPNKAGAVPPSGLTLAIAPRGADERAAKVLDPTRNLIEAGVRSGSVVRIRRERPTHGAAEDRGPSVALLRVLSGPDKGQEFSLTAGVSHIGRLSSCEVRLRDPLVSKKHARVVVGESITVVDNGSSNGLLFGGRRLTKVIVGPSDVLRIGDNYVSIAQTKLAGTVEPTSPNIEFNRSPRVISRFEPKPFATPAPPKRPNPMRFPLISMVAPLIMGAVLFAVTRNLLSIVFIALSPLLMIGMYFDQRHSAKKQLRQEKEDFESTLQMLARDVEDKHRLETAVRLARNPSLAEVHQSAVQLGPLLWAVRPENHEFLAVRLGIGAAPSASLIEEPPYDAVALPEYHQRALAFARAKVNLPAVPIVGDFRSAGTIGVAGPRGVVEGVARGLLFQLVGLHSPAEMVVTVFASPASRPTWEWVEWLPHTGSVYSPLDGGHLSDNQGSGGQLLAQLEDLVAQRLEGLPARGAARGNVDVEHGIPKVEDHAEPILPSIVVLVDDDAPTDRARLVRLAEAGPDAGVHLLWVAAQIDNLPSACRTYISLIDDPNGATTGVVRHGVHSCPVQCETLGEQEAIGAALLLAPVVDAGGLIEDSSDVPQSVSFLDLVGPEVAEDHGAILERWREDGSLLARDERGNPIVGERHTRKRAGNLRGLVGSTGATALSLDLREHGPHALVGGTTGSGKSEFLQSWVLGMAAAHSPDRVTFLFIDYKGGAAFADCVLLPHTVGLVTDLSPHLVRRALTSLRAELRYREHLLNRKKAKDLVSLEKTGDPECPPSLIIVCDEFAALVQEVPEFVDGVVDVAQRGRSLGLHLILATQRPAGVIKDNLRANTNLRIALRMADADDSTDVLGVPDAGFFAPNIPGRAAAKTGPGRLTTFQAAYAGGWTTDEAVAPPIEVEELHFGSPVPWEAPIVEADEQRDLGPTDIARVVRQVVGAAAAARIPAPRKPWMPELEHAYDAALMSVVSVDSALLLGIGDDPANQSQPQVYYRPDRDGNMAIYGTGGAGKSGALRQVAVAAALASASTPAHIYGLDFGSAGLRMLEPLPNVGAIISGDDEERIARLMRTLVALVDERSMRYAEANAGTITDYRRNANRPDEARVIVLVDGMGPFREAYELQGSSLTFGMFTQIAADGRGVGVHVVVTGDRPNAVPPSLGSSIQKRVILRLASEDDYLMMGVPKDILDVSSPPGRAIHGGDEMQFAVLGGDANIAVQDREVARLANALRELGVAPAPAIERLADEVELADLPNSVVRVDRDGTRHRLPVIGVGDQTLGPEGVDTHGPLLLAGPPGSGRTTALLTLAQAIRRAEPTRRRILLATKPQPALAGENWSQTVYGVEQVSDFARQLTDELNAGAHVDVPALAIFIDGITAFNGSAADMPLTNMVKAASGAGHFVVGEGEVSTWSPAYNLAGPFKSGRVGLLLVPDGSESSFLLNTTLGSQKRKDFPPGRGFLIREGNGVKLQVALPDRSSRTGG